MGKQPTRTPVLTGFVTKNRTCLVISDRSMRMGMIIARRSPSTGIHLWASDTQKTLGRCPDLYERSVRTKGGGRGATVLRESLVVVAKQKV